MLRLHVNRVDVPVYRDAERPPSILILGTTIIFNDHTRSRHVTTIHNARTDHRTLWHKLTPKRSRSWP